MFPPDKFNAGVLVVRPDEVVFADMIGKIGTLTSYDGGDTGKSRRREQRRGGAGRRS